MKRLTLVWAFLVPVVFLAENIQNFAVEDSVCLEVASSSGKVRIYAKESGPIEVRSSGSVSSQLARGVLSIKTANAQVEVGVPAHLLRNIQANTASADVSIEGCFDNKFSNERDVAIQTMSGEIAVTELVARRRMYLKTMSGRIRLSKISGNGSASTMSGDITSQNGLGEFCFHTMSGSVTVARHVANQLEAETISGNICFSNPETKSERAKSLSGSIRYTGQ